MTFFLPLIEAAETDCKTSHLAFESILQFICRESWYLRFVANCAAWSDIGILGARLNSSAWVTAIFRFWELVADVT